MAHLSHWQWATGVRRGSALLCVWVVDTLAGYFNVYLLLVSGVSVLLRLRWASMILGC